MGAFAHLIGSWGSVFWPGLIAKCGSWGWTEMCRTSGALCAAQSDEADLRGGFGLRG